MPGRVPAECRKKEGVYTMADGFLFDVKVLELGDEKGEFCGKLFAGAGADVIKIEPPGGAPSRDNGPFYHDQPDRNRSLYFWHYNVGKRAVTLDIQTPQGKTLLEKLIAQSDVIVDSLPLDTLEKLGLDWPALQKLNPRLIYLVLTPFGRSRSVAGLQGDRPDPSGAGRSDDVLRLRSQTRRHLRHPADRAADVARLSHRVQSGVHRGGGRINRPRESRHRRVDRRSDSSGGERLHRS